MEVQRSEGDPASGRRLMPPHLLLRNFLPEETAGALLDFALAHEHAFSPTRTGRGDRRAVRPEVRLSAGTRKLGPFASILTDKVLRLAPDLAARLGVAPPADPEVELQLVAHNDGAHYRPHIDTETGNDTTAIRVISGVYYFHAAPQAFTGGALRLYALGLPALSKFVDIAPEHNCLLVFPSWAPHEVMPVSCPSKRFADSRFAINCWIYRRRAPPPP